MDLNIFGKGSDKKDLEIKRLKHEVGYLEKQKKQWKINTLNLNFEPSLFGKIEGFLNTNFLKKKKLNVIYVSDNKHISLRYIFYKGENIFHINDKTYTFSEEHFYIFKNNPLLIIYENQSTPVILKNNNDKINSKILNSLIHSKILLDIMKKDEGIFGMDINKNLVTIVIAILVFLYLFSTGFFDAML